MRGRIHIIKLEHILNVVFKYEWIEFWKSNELSNSINISQTKAFKNAGMSKFSNIVLNLPHSKRKKAEELILRKLRVYGSIQHIYPISFSYVTKDDQSKSIDTEAVQNRFKTTDSFNEKVQNTNILNPNEDILHIEWILDNVITFYLNIKKTAVTKRSETLLIVKTTIDFDTSSISFKFNKNDFEKTDIKRRQLIEYSFNILNKYIKTHTNVSFKKERVNETVFKKMLFKIYFKWAKTNKQKLEKYIPTNFDELFNQLTTDLKIKDDNSFKRQVKSLIYQDTVKFKKEFSYKDGWIFSYTFKDDSHTKIKSRNLNFESIQGSEIYWNIEELIHQKKELVELGLCSRFNTSSNIYINIRYMEDSITIYYYQKGGVEDDRQQKEHAIRRLLFQTKYEIEQSN